MTARVRAGACCAVLCAGLAAAASAGQQAHRHTGTLKRWTSRGLGGGAGRGWGQWAIDYAGRGRTWVLDLLLLLLSLLRLLVGREEGVLRLATALPKGGHGCLVCYRAAASLALAERRTGGQTLLDGARSSLEHSSSKVVQRSPRQPQAGYSPCCAGASQGRGAGEGVLAGNGKVGMMNLETNRTAYASPATTCPQHHPGVAQRRLPPRSGVIVAAL